MLKQWLDAGKCLLGMHQGDWVMKGPATCLTVQTCQRCGRTTERVEHVWGIWSAVDGHPSCESSRTCPRCHESETRTEHRWAAWTYREAHACEQGRPCEGCGIWSDEQQLAHRWLAWEYSERDRAPVRSCSRCGLRASYFADQVVDQTARLAGERDKASAQPPDDGAASVTRSAAGDSSVKAAIDAIVRDVEAELKQRADSAGLAEQASARMGALRPATQEEQRLHILGYLRLADLFAPEGDHNVFASARQVLLQGLDLLQPEAPPSAVVLQRLRCDAIVSELAAAFERDGFSEYEYQRAFNAIQSLPAESPDEFRAQLEGLIRAIDATLPHAPIDFARMLSELRQWLLKMRDSDGHEELITLEQALAESGALRQEIKEKLEAGGLSSAGVPALKFQLYWAGVSMRLARDEGSTNEQESQEWVSMMMAEGQAVVELLRPYAPDGAQHAANEAVDLVGQVRDQLGVMLSDDQVGQAVAAKALEEQGERMLDAVSLKGASPVPHIQQLVTLLPGFMERVTDVRQSLEDGSDDQAELGQLSKRIDPHMEPVRWAKTEEQFVSAQRDGLRRGALDLRLLERRYHLMLAYPDLPTNPVAVHANCVFFSGSDPVAALLKRSIDSLGMELPSRQGVENEVHGRWQEFRQSSVAVFDYSAHDTRQAESKGLPRSPRARTKAQQTAGRAAMVAYETGWAYVLGTPMVIVARRGQALPFDVDVEPVLLEGDEGDVERLTNGIQVAIYGTQYGNFEESVADTLAHARSRYASRADAQMKTLLEAPINPRDATKARRVLAAVIDRVRWEHPLLVSPAFPAAYPPPGQPQLFHVTAFRDWAEVAREETRLACERHGIEYHIGDERIRPNILRAIWNDICRASFVIADITQLNPNAVLELAIAQAIGRPTLVLTQDDRPHQHFPAIQKVRTHLYNPGTGREELSRLLVRFLTATE